MQGIAAMLKAIKARDLQIPEWLALTPECASLLGRMLEPDPALRISVPDIMQVGGRA